LDRVQSLDCPSSAGNCHDRTRWHRKQYNGTLNFRIDLSGSELLDYTSFAMRLGETCQHDVIERLNMNVHIAVQGTAALPAMGLAATRRSARLARQSGRAARRSRLIRPYARRGRAPRSMVKKLGLYTESVSRPASGFG
jgi:hypothetical protein